MAFTVPDRVVTYGSGKNAVTVNVKIIPDGAVSCKDQCGHVKTGDPVKENEKLNDGTGKPKGITVHNTPDIRAAEGTDPAEQYQRATYPNCNMRGVAVHYWVWHDVIWQQLDDGEQGWHAADGSSRRTDHRGGLTGGNVDTISIECIGSDPESEETLTRLAAWLCRKHGLEPLLDVYTHNYWMHGGDRFFEGVGKNCPYYILPHWGEFLKNVDAVWREIGKEVLPS